MKPVHRIALALTLTTLAVAPLVHAQPKNSKHTPPAKGATPSSIGAFHGSSTCGVNGGSFTTQIHGGPGGLTGTITIRPVSGSGTATVAFDVANKATQTVEVRHSFPSQCNGNPDKFTVDFQITKGSVSTQRRLLAVASAQLGSVSGDEPGSPVPAPTSNQAQFASASGSLSCSSPTATFNVSLNANGAVAGKVVLTKMGSTSPELLGDYSSSSLRPTLSGPLPGACNGRDTYQGLLRPSAGSYDGRGLVVVTTRLDYAEAAP